MPLSRTIRLQKNTERSIAMSKELQLAQDYFELSNVSDFTNIEKLFDENSTFRARNAEFFIGVKDIMAMQKAHHSSYQELFWQVIKIKQLKRNVINVEFEFKGVNQTGEYINFLGTEHIIIRSGIIRHIDVR